MNDSIQRYTNTRPTPMFPDLNGNFCRWSDHQAEIEKRDDEIEWLRRIVGCVVRTCQHLEQRCEDSEPGPLSGPVWGKVAHLCGLGVADAIELCREFDVDPVAAKTTIATMAEGRIYSPICNVCGYGNGGLIDSDGARLESAKQDPHDPVNQPCLKCGANDAVAYELIPRPDPEMLEASMRDIEAGRVMSIEDAINIFREGDNDG